MSKIDKLMNPIYTGSSIVKQYQRAKLRRNIYAGTSMMDFGFASQHALDHEAGTTTMFGGLTCLMLKFAKDQHQIMKELRPQYKEIVARAKQIYKK